MTILYRTRDEGLRKVATATFKGLPIEVRTGYDAARDKWPVHVLIQGRRLNLEGLRSVADSFGDALDLGVDHAVRHISAI